MEPQAASTATTGNQQLYGFFPQSASNAFVTDYSDAVSSNRARHAIIDVTNGTATSGLTSRTSNNKLAAYFTTEQIMGQTKGYWSSSSNNTAGVTANPAILWFITLWTDTADSTSTYSNTMMVTLTQYVRFWGRKALADA